MSNAKQLHINGKKIYPITHESLVIDNDGKTIISKLNEHNHDSIYRKISDTYNKTEIDNKINDKATNHAHTKSQITDFPTSIKNPSSLTIQFNGVNNNVYDGETAKTVNITPSAIGASTSNHNHDTSYYTKNEVDFMLESVSSQDNYEHTINTDTRLKLGYNCIIANEQILYLPDVKENIVSQVKLFVEVQEKGKKVNFGDEEIFWELEPAFNKVGIYKIEFERGFNFWIGNCKYCVSNKDSRNPIYVEIADKLKANSYQGALQIIDNEVKENNEIVVTLNSKFNWGSKVKTYFYNDGKFYWLNSEVVEDGMIKFKSSGVGTYIVALNSAPIFDKNAMRLTYVDNFEEDGDIDKNRWKREVRKAKWTNNEEQSYTDSINNSYIENGKLVIKAVKEDSKYTSAKLISKQNFLYGKFDIVAKLPTGRGTWPAIWMLPENDLYGEWPKSGEIDIMENVGKDAEWIHGSIHSEEYNFQNSNHLTNKVSIPTNSSQYHKYSVIWTPEYIEFLVDDVSYFKHSYNESTDYSKWEAFPFDKPYNLILNLALGGNWGGDIDESIFPCYFYIDSVKIYDLGFNKFDKTPPTDITNLKFSKKVISWDYSYDNVAVKEYKISLDNDEVFTTPNNYLVLDDIDLIEATSGTIVAIDYLNNKSNSNKVKVIPSKVEPLFYETIPLVSEWNNYTDNEAEISMSQGKEGIILDIANGGTNVWDIQLIKKNCQLIKNAKYSYLITLTSSVERDVKLVLQNQEDYQGVHYNDVHLKANQETKFRGDFCYEGETVVSDIVIQIGNKDADFANTQIHLNKFVFVKQQ